MITPASLDEDAERRRTEKGERERESEETGEEEVWTIAFSLEECDHFCLSSRFSLMCSHESITEAESESPNEGLNSDKWLRELLFHATLLLIC